MEFFGINICKQSTRIALLLLLLTTCTGIIPCQSQSPSTTYGQTPILHGDIQTFPLTLIDAYPLITVTVNGLKGKLIFDTGSRDALMLNNNFVNLKSGEHVGSGNTQSGQKFEISVHDTIHEVKFENGVTYLNLLRVKSVNLSFLQDHITPDCAGFMGYEFFKGYLFKLDYLRNKITFYRNTTERQKKQDFLKKERVLAVLRFETRRLPNLPIVYLQAGKLPLLCVFDTGQYGYLQLTPNAEAQLLKKHLLSTAGTDSSGDTLVNLHKVNAGKFSFSLPGLPREQFGKPSPGNKADGISENNTLGAGYRFLSQYKTVWDYDNKKIYVLENL